LVDSLVLPVPAGDLDDVVEIAARLRAWTPDP
jgi:hypothetical protein